MGRSLNLGGSALLVPYPGLKAILETKYQTEKSLCCPLRLQQGAGDEIGPKTLYNSLDLHSSG